MPRRCRWARIFAVEYALIANTASGRVRGRPRHDPGPDARSDPEIFFLESLRGRTRQVRVPEAKAVSACCSVARGLPRARAEHPGALRGLWGGLTVQERQTQLR